MIRIALCGALGRMGQAIAEAIAQQDDMQLIAAVESPNHPGLGTKVINAGVVNNLEPVIATVDVVVDFTKPEGTTKHVTIAQDKKKPFVTGTTALSHDQITLLEKASQTIPIVFAPNMSVGVNLLYKLVEDASTILGDDFDVEISEIHHRYKKDAPSGTAARLAEVIARTKRDSKTIHGRKGMIGERPINEIAVHALRGGDVVGEHTVVFAGIGERLEITHRAHSRATFANGVIRAVRYIMDKQSGFYSMSDVLGLK